MASVPTLTVVNGRLPKIVTPKHYDLTYTELNFQNFTFEGRVAIRVETKTAEHDVHRSRAPRSLVVHAFELQITEAVLEEVEHDGTKIQAGKLAAEEFRYQLHHQTCEIIFANATTPTASIWKDNTTYNLTLNFRGILNDQMAGLYRSTYTNLKGETCIMATTQMEAVDARRAFPCWDEPAFKATFDLHVTIPGHLQAISNTPIATCFSTYDKGTISKTVTFQTTPLMSTFLVALIVGEFDALSVTSPITKLQTTVYTVPGKAQQGQFCLDTAWKCLDYLQEIYGVPYPLNKCDVIAIPDFLAGAMENWGCITYREARVLVQDNATSETTKRQVVRTCCHELAHQWFGNLVTPEFWTQLWLKEGAARFMEFVASDHLFPDWNMWDEFVQSVHGLALGLDALHSSHPVEVEVHHAHEIDEIFDAISYAKGASIIRMLAEYMGGLDVCMKGMRLYLTRHKYGNTTSPDFWKALSEIETSDGKRHDLVAFMEPWTHVVGFPLVQLVADEKGGDFKLATCRFVGSGPTEESSPGSLDKTWPIPVTARVQGMDEVQGPWVLFGPEHDDSDDLMEQIRAWTAEKKWFKLNVNQTGFYRVSYTSEQWRRLASVMDPTKESLLATDRLGLISDSFAAGKAGYTSIVESLRLIEGFGEHETTEYIVWQELSSNLSWLASLIRSESFFPEFQEFLHRIYASQLQQLGWDAKDGESGRTGTMRATVLSMMGIAQVPAVLEEAFRRFIEYFGQIKAGNAGEMNVPGDMQPVLFRLALRHDEEGTYKTLKYIFENHGSISPDAQKDCLVAMGYVKDPKRHADMLNYVFFSGKVRFQDIIFPLGSLSSGSDAGGLATWSFFTSNFDRLFKMFGSGPMWTNIVGLSCRGLQTREEADQVDAFFAQSNHSPGTGTRRLEQALEVVRTEAARRERDRPALTAYFSAMNE